MKPLINKEIVYKTGSLKGATLGEEKAPAPQKFFTVKIISDETAFYYNKNGYIINDINDASLFEYGVALQVVKTLKKGEYKNVSVFGITPTEENTQPVIEKISDCKLTGITRIWCS